MSISEVARRNIFDLLRVEEVRWYGRLNEVDFLSRMFNLNEMRSFDHRFSDAAGDIHQHTIMNPGDWEPDWIYSDPRFDLLHCKDEMFLRFLCEIIHPVVRPDQEEVAKLLKVFNGNLVTDGWQIVEVARISDKPVFAGRPVIQGASVPIDAAKEVAAKLDSDYISQQITRMEAAVANDPELAIGTSKEFVETICKTILEESGEKVADNANLLQLVKIVREKLELLPTEISGRAKGADTIKRLISNLGAAAQGIAELRNLYGSGHGKPAKVKGLKSRHARLAVGAASTLGVFFFETYKEGLKTAEEQK